MINYRRHRQAVERLYEDRATISRLVPDKDPKTKETKQTTVLLYCDVPCRISQMDLPLDGQTEAQNDILYDMKLFISPDLEVEQGDRVEVVRGRICRRYVAGEPILYPSHQEVNLQRKEWA